MRSSRIIVFLAALAGCNGAAETHQQQCHDGICGPGSSGAGAGSSNSASSGSPTSSSSSGGCTEVWQCTPWAKQADGSYTRVCTDADGCGTTANKPPEGPVMLPDLDLDYYKCKVEPIFDRSCSMLGCHGTETGRAFKIYARGRLRHKETVPQVNTCPIGPQMVDLQDMGSGTVMCIGWSPHTAAEWASNYDISRSFMLGLTDADQSDLIAQPIIGGKAHAGVHLFAKGDADYTTIHAWLGGAKLGSTCNPAPN
jgi:hypothetical protein